MSKELGSPMLFDEMNNQIVGLLRLSSDPQQAYAAEYIDQLRTRIAELEAVVAKITVIVDDHAEFDDAMQDIHTLLSKLKEG